MDSARYKKLFILIGIFIVILIILFIVLLMGRQGGQGPATTPTPSPFLTPGGPTATSIPTPTFIPITFTGQADDELPEEDERAINTAFDLRQRLPLEEDGFSIDYDYYNSNFVVYIEPPYIENKTKFDGWMQENGYDTITEPFIFESVE